MDNAPPDSPSPTTQRIAQRYELHERLGRGGMATVHRVTDLKTGKVLALKQLVLPEKQESRAAIAALFEREFHTLAELSHPRVIAVYDYGVDPSAGHYYTMELLEGGDLRERAPVPWREACRLIIDVCSSLALLHSRRLLHRDVSPRNIRCTHDGRAKLFDFGAMAPMGNGGNAIVGTPAFTAPEILQRSALDARTDLYSLGATLYYALTGSMAYPARDFAEVMAAWNFKPAPPSSRVAGIPAALDDLVLSMLGLEPELRPRSAFEVMQRLAAIADLESSESDAVSQAYLSTPTLVGREATLEHLRKKLPRAAVSGAGGVLILGEPGVGRSRMLDALALEAKPLGVTVLRATTSDNEVGFGVALGLARQLLEALPNECAAAGFPELFERASDREDTAAISGQDSPATHETWKLKSGAALAANSEWLLHTLRRFMLTVSRARPLLVAVDDLHRIDEPSAAVLAALVDKAGRGSLLVAMTADAGAAATTQALGVLMRRCEVLTLEPLSVEQTRTLLASMFGEVANLALVADEIYKIARGNPRQCIDLAQHLLDKRVIRYAGGTWTLPERLSSADLPSSGAEAMRARIAAFSPLARSLAEAQALAFHSTFSREDYRALCPELDARHIDAAISELLMAQVLVGDVSAYSHANRLWSDAFASGMSATDCEQRQRALAEMFLRKSDNMAAVHHLFAGGLDVRGLDLMLAQHAEYAKQFDSQAVLKRRPEDLGPSYARALQVAQQLQRPARDQYEIRRWLLTLSAVGDERYYWSASPAWLSQVERDSGLAAWRADSQNADPQQRITNALQQAQAQHLATPEHERVYRVDEAIGFLAQYVAFSIAIGGRTMNSRLLRTLPPLLEPFAPLSPVVDALHQNSIAAREASCDGHFESARERWTAVYDKFAKIDGAVFQHVDAVRGAVAYAVGMVEVLLGLPSAANWAARLDEQPMHRLSAVQLRKIVRLEQGDSEGAERLRRHAEELTLQGQAPQMFSSLLAIELTAQSNSRDLVGVKDVMERIDTLALQHPGWVPYMTLAQARFQQIRGDLIAAQCEYERAIEQSALDAEGHSVALPVWIAAEAGRSEVLLAQGAADDARSGANAALAICQQRGIGAQKHELTRALALSEAKLGDHASAIARLDALISTQTAVGTTGLKLGLSYEARARVAIWTSQAADFETYARLAAREYRHGARSALGARYESLLNEARRQGFQPGTALGDFEPTTIVATLGAAIHDLPNAVGVALDGALETSERAQRALRLVCDSRAANGGHFYLVSADGLRLAASRGLPAPPESLAALVSEHLSRERESADTMTVMATSAASFDEIEGDSTAQVDGVIYDLLILGCAMQDAGQLVGVMAVAASEKRVVNPRQGQLLAAIASHLVRAGDIASAPAALS